MLGRIRRKFFNYSIINAHTPTEDKSDTEKDAIYDGLRNLYVCPKHDAKLIIGNLNAQIGKGSNILPYHREGGLPP